MILTQTIPGLHTWATSKYMLPLPNGASKTEASHDKMWLNCQGTDFTLQIDTKFAIQSIMTWTVTEQVGGRTVVSYCDTAWQVSIQYHKWEAWNKLLPCENNTLFPPDFNYDRKVSSMNAHEIYRPLVGHIHNKTFPKIFMIDTAREIRAMCYWES